MTNDGDYGIICVKGWSDHLSMKINKTKFRASNNKRYTQQLFRERSDALGPGRCTIEPMFSLYDDVEGLINFGKEYVKDMDPTGYKTAVRLLENYDHFKQLCQTKWFQEAVVEWNKEIAAKMEQEATDILRGIALDSDLKPAERISAAKAILGKAKAIKAPREAVRGRPSTEEVQGELKRQAALTKDELEDLKRIKGV